MSHTENNSFDFNSMELFDPPVLDFSPAYKNEGCTTEEFLVDLENIEDFLDPPVKTEQESTHHHKPEKKLKEE